MSASLSLNWSNQAGLSDLDSDQQIQSEIGENVDILFTVIGTAVDVSGWTFAALIAPDIDSAPCKSWTDSSFNAKTSGGTFKLSAVVGDTSALPGRNYFIEVRRVDSGFNHVISRGFWTLAPSPFFTPVSPPSGIVTVSLGGTGSDLSATGPGVIIQAVAAASLSVLPGDASDTTHFLRKDLTFSAPAGGSWGSITGTLSSQSDLQSALDAKQPLDDQLTSLAALDYTGNATKVIRLNAGETGFEFADADSGSGTVTTVSVTPANGISGTVATATTTPAITLSLDAITPATVNGLTITPTTGTLTITNAKTVIFGNSLTFTGTDNASLSIGNGGGLGSAAFSDSSAYDSAGAAAAAQAASQPLDATLTALAAQNWAANAIPVGSGSDTVAQVSFAANTFPARASSGNLVAKTITDFGLSLVNDADAATARTTLGLGTLATQSGTFSGTSSGTNTGDQTITLTGNVTGSGTGSFATTIAAGVVTLAMQANMATASLVYRKTAGSGAPEVNTLATLKTDLGLTGTNSGDQTTIVGITGTIAQFNTACTDADFVTSGGALGTPSSGTLANCTGLPISTGVSGVGTGVATALAVNVGSAGAPVTFNGAGGTPSSITLTNATGTASGLTAGNVTTNANLTGPITSSGNTTSIASQTGTGTTLVTSVGPTITGTLTLGDATTPSLSLASGKTNTGAVTINGKTSGSLKLTTADATAQAVTVTAAAQTTAASTLTIPDQGGSSRNFVFDSLAQTLTGKTISGSSNTFVNLPAAGISGVIPIANLATGTPNGSKFVRDDGTLAVPAGSGTVTATGGSLTANAIVLGAGTTDTKVVAGITSDGTSQISLGVNATTLGKVKMFGNTSGDVTIQPAAVAGTATVLTLPAATGTLATLDGTETFTNKTLTSPNITTSILPTSDDGAALGSTSKKFSDLFLASGGVIDWASSNVTITHSSGLLTLNAPISLSSATASATGFNVLLSAASGTNTGIHSELTGATAGSNTGILVEVSGSGGGSSVNSGIIVTCSGATSNAAIQIQSPSSGSSNWAILSSSTAKSEFSGDILVDTAGTTTTSVATNGGTQTLTNKTLTAPKFVNAGFIADNNGNEQIVFGTTASAINYVRIINSATGNPTVVKAGGDDTDVDLLLAPQGSGFLRIVNGADNTKAVYFDISGTTTSCLTKLIFTSSGNRFITFPDATDILVGKATADTLANKRIAKRTGSTTSSATPTINTDNVDMYLLTAQAADITSFTTNLTGTPSEGDTLWIVIVGTAARAITWGSKFESSTATLPTTTVSTNRLDVIFVWNTVSLKWRCLSVA